MAARPDVPRLLLVGGDRDGTRHLEAAVAAEGWDAWTVSTGADAVTVAVRFRPHLAVIDMVLPDLDGLQVMRRLRADRPDLPVLFVTTIAGVEARVQALTAGGDDCVTRPFFLPELVSRLRALLRRSRPANPAASLSVGDLTLHEPSRVVRRGGRTLALTMTEYELLRYLMANAGRALPREQIFERVWQFDPKSSSRTVDFHVAHLRRKVDADGPPLIHTIRGIGYILEER
ncbi:response regulator transcription factor [Actinoplanes sp. NPDC026619]|uniref:response regulator transcription factor n=1 Tax=Actinoplanes sp. NPDC026619 TaxID=3155798 RepID=UPI0033DFA8B7